jgi:Crp-like helix-turn-helix protein
MRKWLWGAHRYGSRRWPGWSDLRLQCHAFNGRENVRWLLMMHDRTEGEALPYTHEFLSHMLGANRKSVTLAARSLQTAGFISYRRGRIQVLDRPGPRKGVVRMLRCRKGAVRCLFDSNLGRGSGRYNSATRQPRSSRASLCRSRGVKLTDKNSESSKQPSRIRATKRLSACLSPTSSRRSSAQLSLWSTRSSTGA